MIDPLPSRLLVVLNTCTMYFSNDNPFFRSDMGRKSMKWIAKESDKSGSAALKTTIRGEQDL